ncbi:Arc family DNA-binding protein [Listeria monocytogenes]|nr:Arc family DNA-binding protein [Listeria monocytogenes]
MKIQLLLRVPDSMKKDLKEVAERKGMTVNGFVNSELRRILDNELKHTSNT